MDRGVFEQACDREFDIKYALQAGYEALGQQRMPA
jgi:hypothetical protein